MKKLTNKQESKFIEESIKIINQEYLMFNPETSALMTMKGMWAWYYKTCGWVEIGRFD